MAEPTTSTPTEQSRTPALPSTADAIPYVPVSWMAVGAAAAALAFLISLLVLGYSARTSRRPMISAPEVLFSFSAVAVLLSFAARRLIRDSDGTRTGHLFNVNLPAVSWWIGLIGFLGYGAYYIAIEYSIQREAKSEVLRWVGFIQDGQINRAFHRTLEPGRRGGINPDDAKRLQDEFREPLLAFTNSDLIRLVQRNDKSRCQFQAGGLRDWAYKDNTIECLYTGMFICPEGRFPIRVPLKGFESTSGTSSEGVGRQWQVLVAQEGFVQTQESRLTEYGWMIVALEMQGMSKGQEFIAAVGTGPSVRPYAFHSYVLKSSPILKPGEAPDWEAPVKQLFSRIGAGGGGVLAFPYSVEYQRALAGFLRLPTGADVSPKDHAKFMTAWNEGRGFIPAGTVIRSSSELAPIIVVTPTAVQVRVSVEIPESEALAIRGRLVVECTDQAVLDDLKRRLDSADPNAGTKSPPEEIRNRLYNWRVTRLESDMVVLKPPTERGSNPAAPPGSSSSPR